MSIEDDLLEPSSITAGDRALALFTDRYELTRLFVERLNDDLTPQNILFFYGEGGNGKSLLLKYLRQKACKRMISPTDWAKVKAKPDAELAAIVTRLKPGTYHPVPTTFLDFGSKPLGDVQPQDRFFGLLTLRKELAESAAGNASLKFRRFDFACVWYLFKKGRSPEEIKSFFPADQAGNLASVLIDILTKNPVGTVGKALLDLAKPNWNEQLMTRMARLGLDKAEIQTMLAKDLDTELIDALPGYLADDLNEAMAKDTAPPRVVLFFDTHEAFWGEHRSQAPETYFFRDEWLRRLLRKLDYGQGIVALVAGRDQPRWTEAKPVQPGTDIPERYVDLRRVGNLSVTDALAYLQQPKVGIGDAALCQSLIAYASVEPGEVHPLHLGLCADVVLEAETQGTPLTAEEFGSVPDFAQKSEQLVERLLKYVSAGVRDAIYALSACRAFDFALYNQLGETLKFAANRADFDLITRFSFVKQLPEPRQQWRRLHGLLRRLNAAEGHERVMAAHRLLEQHYREIGQQAEAIYHANQLNPRQGIQEWVEGFDKALKNSQYQNCEFLMEVQRELAVVSTFQLGQMSTLSGDYYQSLAKYGEAEQEYLLAIRSYRSFLSYEPSNWVALNNQGLAMQKLGDLQTSLTQYESALSNYQQAVAAFEKAWNCTSDAIGAVINQGNTLRRIGELQANLLKLNDALDNYEQSIEAYDKVLHFSPDNIDALMGLGHSLQALGLVQSLLPVVTDALKNYEKSITAYGEALRLCPDDICALNGRGAGFAKSGLLQERALQFDEALKSYEQAATTFGDIHRSAPNELTFLNNEGLALVNMGRLQANLFQYNSAFNNFKTAISAYDKILERAPDYIEVLNNKGLAYSSLGQLQSTLGGDTEGFLSLHVALSCFNHSLRLAPNDAFICEQRDQVQAWLDGEGNQD